MVDRPLLHYTSAGRCLITPQKKRPGRMLRGSLDKFCVNANEAAQPARPVML